jgi:hypothetical protein
MSLSSLGGFSRRARHRGVRGLVAGQSSLSEPDEPDPEEPEPEPEPLPEEPEPDPESPPP